MEWRRNRRVSREWTFISPIPRRTVAEARRFGRLQFESSAQQLGGFVCQI